MKSISEQKTILLIEDSVDDERLTLRALRKNNIMNEVVVAEDAEKALELISRKGSFKPSLIILDLQLPKMDGLELIRVIRSEASTASVPIVVLTSREDEGTVRQCYANGANSFVKKPVDGSEFGEAILEIVMYWLLLNRLPDPVKV